MKQINKKGDIIFTSKKSIFQEFKEKQKREKQFWYGNYMKLYRLFWRLIRLPGDIKRNTIAFFQRGWRGYADCDTWDFCDYLTKIIIGGLTDLNRYVHGHPITVKNKKEWKKKLKEMIKGFKAFKKACNTISPEQYDKYIKEFRKGAKVFIKYYGSLWD